MTINPLLFIPSPRDIPEVIESWDTIRHDRLIIKRKLEPRAYREGRDFFLEHKEYTHLVICPDDLVLNSSGFNILMDDIKEHNYATISGIANIDETSLNVKCCQPTGSLEGDKPPSDNWYRTDRTPYLPTEPIFEAGHSGFACQFISRRLMQNLSFTGIKDGGFMDWKMSKECKDLKIPIMIDRRAEFYHMRNAQYKELHAWIDSKHVPDEGQLIHQKYY